MKQIPFYLLYGLVYLLSLLPLWLHYRFADLLYLIIYYGVGYRRRIVRKNLERSFPEKQPQELRQIERQFYRFFCDYMVENIKLLTMSKRQVMKRMVFEGLDEVNHSFETHDLVFSYLGHYGNWEYIASLQWWFHNDVHCAQLYSKLRNHAFDRLFLHIRSRYGGENINKKEALRHILDYRAHHQKAIIGFIADQTPKWTNIHYWMEFLHQDTPVFTGTERIAHKVNAAIYYADVTRPRRGYYRCRFRLITDNVSEFQDNELTALYMRELEKSIRAVPYLWLWTHNRWKRQRDSHEWEQHEQLQKTLHKPLSHE